MNNEQEISRLLTETKELEANGKLLLDDMIFTNRLVDDLPPLEDVTDDVRNGAIRLMSRLRINYEQMVKNDERYNQIRERLVELGVGELLPELEPLPPMDFDV